MPQPNADSLPLENDLAERLSLDGDWEFRLGDAPTRTIPVPSAWEAHVPDKITDGPAVYRRRFLLPDGWSGGRVLLHAQAVSFDAAVRLNGQLAGRHRGMWSPFQVDLTPCLQPGENTLEIEVWKPGERFPVRESLAGFLPDVCTTFGGIWQSASLLRLERAALRGLRVRPQASGRLEIGGRAELIGESPAGALQVVAELTDRAGRRLAQADGPAEAGRFELALEAPEVTPWTPEAGADIYAVTVSLLAGENTLARASRCVGFRDIAAREGKTWLNGQPLHLRGVLDWGWDPTTICPPRNTILDQVDRARALGFNLIKLCLFVPDEAVLDAADAAGMSLWLEMPMWLPRLTEAARTLALDEYRAVFARLHYHPSIAIVSLGCELNSEADAGFLAALDGLAREWLPNTLRIDNSGSAEAYGGVLTGLGDFYDYHFYTDPHFFPALVDHFDRAYQPERPWLYGEFCDADTLRDFSQLQPEPWWLSEPVALDRDDFVYMREYRQRLAAAGVEDGGAALTAAGRRQATAVRKFILEHVRSRSATGGYVVTGWADTPIATSGMVDDFGQLKFDPADWRQFNADRVLVIDRERRRRWIGGDRPAHKDPFTWGQGERAEIHVLLSNGGPALGPGRLEWKLADEAGAAWARGEQAAAAVQGGDVAEIAVLGIDLPEPGRAGPLELGLHVRWLGEAEPVANQWRLWVAPRPRLPETLAVAEPLLHRLSLARLDPAVRVVPLSGARPGAVPALATDLTPELAGWVGEGGSAVLWLQQPDSRFTRPAPFWREAIHVFEPHPLWELFPHPGHADLRFFGVASDFALEIDRLATTLGTDARLSPLWRRFDARAMTWADYVLDVGLGRGRLLVTTLSLAGGLGHQPASLESNPAGAALLSALLDTATISNL